jgi:lipopolysaccharide/colanic/teichoic acid biosynthesis glycosyltransferase
MKVCNSEFAPLDSLFSFNPPCRLDGTAAFGTCLKNPPTSSWAISRTKRLLDFCLAFLALVVFAVPIILIAVCVRLTSRGNALFAQKRVGMGGRLFWIYKFRSMTENYGKKMGPDLTKSGDRRVTFLGRYLRKFKLDELPQFFNILRGDMSLVGPRPKLPQYAAIPNMPYRPGITGAATIAFRREEEILQSIDAERIDTFYSENIKPLKARLDVCYMCKATPASDIGVIASTILGCVIPQYAPSVLIPGTKTTGADVMPHHGTVPEQNPAAD